MKDKRTILAIGNSFSRDATVFLHDAAKSAGLNLTVVNLYIGGCSLERHAENLESNDTVYLVEVNGAVTDKYSGLRTVVESTDWDEIVTQQSSHDSGWLDTYEPYAGKLFGYLGSAAPKSKIHIMQTWAYESNSTHPLFIRYNRDRAEMYNRSRAAYMAIADKYSLPVIPCGDVVEEIRKTPEFDISRGGQSICRDGFHMHLVYGRYLLSAVWLKSIFGLDVSPAFIPTNPAAPSAEPKKLALILEVVAKHFK
ncbi:MAG: DUF4886 domain-containing protein [Lachnospiraceae bacterium]|nr:DUF4886 domain-containing protein [Lachnospiraceae bacterium]